MFVLVRAVTYATLFIGLLLVFVPARILERSGMVRPAQLGAVEYTGIVVAVAGWTLALWCILTFALIGRGTPCAVRSAAQAGDPRSVPVCPQSDVPRGGPDALRRCALLSFARVAGLHGCVFLLPRTSLSCGMRSQRSRACSRLTTRRIGRGVGRWLVRAG